MNCWLLARAGSSGRRKTRRCCVVAALLASSPLLSPHNMAAAAALLAGPCAAAGGCGFAGYPKGCAALRQGALRWFVSQAAEAAVFVKGMCWAGLWYNQCPAVHACRKHAADAHL